LYIRFAAHRPEKAVDGTHQHFVQCRQLRDLPYGLAFFDFVDGVSKNVVELPAQISWPKHFDFIHNRFASKDEVKSSVIGGIVAAAGVNLVELRHFA
jgi:hypothetical protein